MFICASSFLNAYDATGCQTDRKKIVQKNRAAGRRKRTRYTKSLPMKTAFVFPGQGSQYVGMGRSLVENFPEARAIFDQADQALGFSLSQLCFEGPPEALQLT